MKPMKEKKKPGLKIKKHLMIGLNVLPKNMKGREKYMLNIGDIQSMLQRKQQRVEWLQVKEEKKEENEEKNKNESNILIIRKEDWIIISRLRKLNVLMPI